MSAKVCLVSPEYPPLTWGGLARTCQRVAQSLSGLGVEVHVAHLIFSDQELVLLDENRRDEAQGTVVVHRLRVGQERLGQDHKSLWDCPHTLTFRQSFQSLELLQRDCGFDLFHSWFLYPVGYLTGLLARREHRPHIASMVGNDLKKYLFSPEKVALAQSALTNSDLVVGISRDLVDLANALVPVRDRSAIIHNGVDIPARSWRPGPESEPPVIGFAGIFKYAKGLPYLLKAVAELSRKREIRLSLLGEMRPAEEPLFRDMVQSLSLGPLVTLEPARDQPGVQAWLLDLDLFCLPSISEGCPNILMEAMALGVPCVAADVGAVPELIDHGRSGLTVPWGDSKALARALSSLLDNQELAVELGGAGRERMRTFSTEREQREWQEVYQRFLPEF